MLTSLILTDAIIFFFVLLEENAEAPLSQVYENGSALEQMHSYMLLQTMKYHGMGVLLDDPETGSFFR